MLFCFTFSSQEKHCSEIYGIKVKRNSMESTRGVSVEYVQKYNSKLLLQREDVLKLKQRDLYY